MPEQLAGVIERITFHNLDSGYCVLRVRAAGHRDPITVVGHLPQVVAGEYVDAAGEWVNDRSFGTQFKAATLLTHPPHTAEGIAKYLGSGLVRGIGPKYARKIVAVFGEKTLDVIESSVSRLAEVKGIGPKRIELIRQGWHQSRGVRDILTFLMSYGVGTARAVRIYRAYGENAIRLIQENPYRLTADIWGIGFRTADELALKLGIPRDAPQRVQAAVRHVLTEASGTRGHVALPEPVLSEETVALTQATGEQVADAIEALRVTDELVRDAESPESADPGLSAEPLLYLKPLFLAELGVSRLVTALKSGPAPLPGTDVEAALAWAESRMGLSFAGSQRAAVRQAVSEKFLVLTGGPGTGKTTIVRAVLDIVTAKALRVLLCAPTGRAAKRLSESTGREAKTIHRVLEFDTGTAGFRRNKENPLDLDLLVVDETSMVDVVLMNKLLQAVPPWAGVLLVGDVDQLPSVGPGSVLRDLIESDAVPVARLTEVHRQAGGSHIVRAAHAINRGDEPESAPTGSGDFYFIEADDPATVIDRILTVVRDRIPAKFGLDAVRDVQLLSPMNKSDLGVQNLNRVLQQAVNPPADGAAEVARFGTTFRVGDKVIQTRNNYQREVFNGDIGRVTGVDAVDQVLTVEFDGKDVEYEFADLDELQLGYCVSVHKSQGSEYPAIVVPVHTQHWVMLQRNLLYTAVTRGRKLVVLVGKRYALQRAVRTADTNRRFGRLAERLRAAGGERPASAGR